ncbi:MAG: hypothetical protein ACI3ZN_00400 [Candidatus Cryptobacteroides sp.]
MKDKIDSKNYIAPAVETIDLSLENVLCQSGNTFGFKSTDGVVDGDPNSADYGYDFFDNGSY